MKPKNSKKSSAQKAAGQKSSENKALAVPGVDLRQLEQLLAFLSDAGVPDRLAAYLGDLLGLYIAAFTFEESLWERDEAGQDSLNQFSSYLETLPAERFPHLAHLRDEMTEIGHDERFELGLEIILQGVARLSSSG